MSGFSLRLTSIKKPGKDCGLFPAFLIAYVSAVAVNVPAKILANSFFKHISAAGLANRDMMLEALFTYVLHKTIHVINLTNSYAAKSIERIIGELAFTNITTNFSFAVIRRNAQIKSIGPGATRPLQAPKQFSTPRVVERTSR